MDVPRSFKLSTSYIEKGGIVVSIEGKLIQNNPSDHGAGKLQYVPFFYSIQYLLENIIRVLTVDFWTRYFTQKLHILYNENFWICLLSATDPTTGLYSWAVISAPYLTRIEILARDPYEFQNSGEMEWVVSHMAGKRSFDEYWNEPRELLWKDCE